MRGAGAGEAERRALGHHGRSEGGRDVVERGLELGAAARRLAGPGPRRSRARPRRRRSPPRPAARPGGRRRARRRCHRRRRARRAAAGRAQPARRARSRISSERDVVARQQARQRAAPALALALGRGALLGEALDRLGADAVDVVEDGAGQAVERARLVPGGLAGGHEALPGQARADAVRAEQRVEAAPGAHLAAPEGDVDLARAAVARRGVLDAVDEARERPLDADAERAPEGALERPRVVGHLAADRGDDVLREVGQRRAQGRRERWGEVVRHVLGARLQICGVQAVRERREMRGILCHTLRP